jgi:putative ABC transport system permease protein
LLRTLGAPARFIVSVVWSQAAVLLVLGTALGMAFGVGVAAILSRIVTQETGILIEPGLSWRELHLAAGFLCISSVLALFLGLRAARSARRDRLQR